MTVYPLCASFFHFIQTSNALSSPFEERGGKQREREKIYNWWLSALRDGSSVIGHTFAKELNPLSTALHLIDPTRLAQ